MCENGDHLNHRQTSQIF